MSDFVQCEGWTRRGGMMTIGPVKWTQCENEATRLICVEQGSLTEDMPACEGCILKAVDNNIKILESVAI